MKFTIDRNVIINGVQKVLGVTDKKTTSPFFNNLHLIASREGITVKATDVEVSVVVFMPARVENEGSVLLVARRVYEMLKEMQGADEVVFIQGDDMLISLQCGNALYKIQGLNDEEYPLISVELQEEVASVASNRLVDMIKKTINSASNEAMRRNINGMFLECDVEKSCLRMVGTDGNRLSLFNAEAVLGSGKMVKGLIIGKKGAVELKKNLEGLNEEVLIGLNGGFIVFKTRQMLMQLNTIEAEYPDYRRVIVLAQSSPLVVNKEEILRSLRIMRVVADVSYTGVIMDISNKCIKLSSVDANVGEAKDEVVVDYAGTDINVSYNVHFLIEAIEGAESVDVLLDLGAEGKPLFVKETVGDNYLAVVMPVRLV
ncbi:MAG: DNA polymerase III subunit beta [Deltaproteobacteria bacterium]|nr:DNA polymerase III subunit beta [Deltaproteobacteria bacterium]